MLHLLLSAALAPLLVSADVSLTAGTQLNFRGGVEARVEEPGKGRKTFDLTLWILKQSDAAAEIFWLIDERGRGEFPWSQRFGRVSVDAQWRTAAAGPAVLYDRGDGRSVVPISWPFLASEKPLAAGESFRDGKLEFQVEKAAKVADTPVWHVNARDPFGPKRTLRVDKRSALVWAMTEKFTMGRGDEYQLSLELIGGESLSGEQLTALTKTIDKLAALGGKLNLPAQSQEVDWKDEQLALLREQLPPLAQLAVGTPLAKLIDVAQRDFQLQSGRSGAVAELSSKFGGRPVEDFAAKGFGGEALDRDALRGRVTVLHFWEYRDEPLKEPYGQVGYLDFMYHRRGPNGLQLYGVAVDGRLADEKTRPSAERSVKKLKSFMNLSYPVLLDSGGLLKKFGDPRLLGASLPLFVVIGPDQKIIHYHVGHYEVSQDQGLTELDQVVLKALEQK
jgi:hypothetical protein